MSRETVELAKRLNAMALAGDIDGARALVADDVVLTEIRGALDEPSVFHGREAALSHWAAFVEVFEAVGPQESAGRPVFSSSDPPNEKREGGATSLGFGGERPCRGCACPRWRLSGWPRGSRIGTRLGSRLCDRHRSRGPTSRRGESCGPAYRSYLDGIDTAEIID